MVPLTEAAQAGSVASAPAFSIISNTFSITRTCLKSLAAKLKERRVQISAHQLASVGRKAIPPSFADDVKLFRDAVLQGLEGDQDAILVLHSYAGMPGSEAVNQLIDLGALNSQPDKGRLRRVVYIAAYMFPAGFKMDAKMFVGGSDPMFSIDDSTGFASFRNPYMGFFNDMSREDAQPFLDQLGETYYLGPDPAISSENYRQAPMLYVRCEKDQAMPLERQIGISQGMPNILLSTGHSPFVSQPAIVADILEKVAKSR